MARAKKVDTDKLIRMANEYCKVSGDQFADKREAIHDFVASVLLDAGAYKGFRYLTENDVKPGMKWGITFNADTLNHEYPDKTRTAFY